MIRHIILMKMAEEAEGRSGKENMELLKTKLEALPSKIQEIKFYEVGVNMVETPNSYDLVLVSEFESLDTLKIYIAHPEHRKVVEFLSKVVADRKSVDYEF
jgi:Stress responsive A/B Barrel Domain